MPRPWTAVTLLLMLSASVSVFAQTPVLDPSDPDYAECHGYFGPGGACYNGPGGGLYSGPGGGLYPSPGGGLYTDPGGGLCPGPGGGLYPGPGGGLYPGPGGGIYPGPPKEDGYHAPWSPCITGVLGKKWMAENC
jgi:hypothetical protein